jgi:cytochrome c-type biogenesis protein CcmE
MDGRRLKFFLLGAAMVATMGFLIVAGARQGGLAYYVTVSEFLDHPPATHGFRVNGQVAEGTIERLSSGLDVRFRMTDGRRILPVAYHGVIPDTFVDGADVVVEGSLGADGTFRAHTLLAKCPSKYEAADTAKAKVRT